MFSFCVSQLVVESVLVTKDFLTYMVQEFYWNINLVIFAYVAANKLKWMCFLAVSLGHSSSVQPFESLNMYKMLLGVKSTFPLFGIFET